MTNCTKEHAQEIVDKYWEREWAKIKEVDFPSSREFPITIAECKREIQSLAQEDKSNKARSSTILYFHDSRKYANVINCLSPYDYWQKLKEDSELFKKFYANRLRCSDWFKEKDGANFHYLDEGYVPMFIYSIGLTTSRKASLVTYFKPALAKNLIKKYLNEYSTVFDPCSGYSGRLIGALCSGKNYIGQDINDLSVSESLQIANFVKGVLNSDVTFDLSVKDSLKECGKYECLLTCPPYGANKHTLETWQDSKGNKIVSSLTCSEWVKSFLRNYECEKYVFVIDDDKDKVYYDYVKEILTNTSHFGNNQELVVVITKEERNKLIND